MGNLGKAVLLWSKEDRALHSFNLNLARKLELEIWCSPFQNSHISKLVEMFSHSDVSVAAFDINARHFSTKHIYTRAKNILLLLSFRFSWFLSNT